MKIILISLLVSFGLSAKDPDITYGQIMFAKGARNGCATTQYKVMFEDGITEKKIMETDVDWDYCEKLYWSAIRMMKRLNSQMKK